MTACPSCKRRKATADDWIRWHAETRAGLSTPWIDDLCWIDRCDCPAPLPGERP